MTLRTNVLLVVQLTVLGILAAAAQLIATRWGFLGELAGGLLGGIIILAGWQIFALGTERIYLLSLVAAAASLLGVAFAIAGAGVSYMPAVWAAPLLAAFPAGVFALRIGLHGARCQLCRAPLRRLLSFSCPRCNLVACENCWQFERGRCRLCEANQVPLFPLDASWWKKHFGAQAHGGRCALCLQAADWNVAHWACAACGHSQCRSCWDDNNGQCSRCGWTIPELPEEVSAFVAAGARPEKTHRSVSG